VTELNSNPPKTSPRVRRAFLLGSAVALVLGGAVASEAVLPNSPALAQPVAVNPVQAPGFADMVEKVSPAVVGIRVRGEATSQLSQFQMPNFGPEGGPMDRFFREFRNLPDQPQMRPRPTMSMGSGFFVSDDGYVVTNNHVVDNATEFTVIMNDGTEYPATLVGKDGRTDLALLKVEADRRFEYVQFAKDDVRVGDWVIAVGTPFGLGGTVTAGIVSGRGRQIGEGPYDDFLQIDAAVNRGNSGGPTFNLKGEVVGVNTAIFSPTGGNVGIAFAIPANSAEHVVGLLKDHGQVVRGWLGIQIQTVDQAIADSLGLDEVGGALVAEPQPGSPAANAGLRAGDTILAVDGEAIENARALALRIGNLAPNTRVDLTIWRDGARTELPVTLGTMPGEQQVAALQQPQTQQETPAAQFSDFGMQIGPSEEGGVVITEIDPTGAAAGNGLQPGDVIVSVGTTDVSSPEEVQTAVARAKEEGLKAVLFRVKSGENTRFVALPFAA